MKRDIEILSVTYLRGPNMWTYQPAMEVLIDIGELEDFPSNLISGFPERLTQWLPSLAQHRCSYDEPGGFLRRLQEGTWPGHILEHVTLELQELCGMPEGGFGRAREISKRGHYKVVVSLWHEEVTLTAFKLARELVLAAMGDKPFDVAAAVARIRSLVEDHCLGPSTAAIVAAAEEQRIPCIRLNEGNLVQLGYGCRQRRIWTAETDRTSAIGEGISRDKDLTKQLLSSCGVPVPEGRLVSDVADAWAAAQEVGLPVVVKPYDGNHGRGVFIDMRTQQQVEAAWRVAVQEGSGVMVERYVPGNEHRLLVVGDRLAAAARGEPAYVTADGISSIRQLVDAQLNTDPLRSSASDSPLNLVTMDSMTRQDLAQQGYEPDSTPAAGTRVLIQRNGNVCFDCTALVHPETARLAILSARIVGLDIAGVDLVAEDISKPLTEQRGAIVEVNAGPGLGYHIVPPGIPPTPVGAAIIKHLFSTNDTGRIPVIGVTGTGATTGTARILAHLLQLSGQHVGLACGDGLFLGTRRIDHRDSANWRAGQRLLVNRTLQTAVIENGVRTLLDEGLAYDRCHVGVVTKLDQSGLVPDRHIDTDDALFKVIRTQVDVVLRDGFAVLNAADMQVAAMAELCDGQIIYFSADPNATPLAVHVRDQGRAVVLQGGFIVLMHGTLEIARLRAGSADLSSIDPAGDGTISLLASVAAAWASGLQVVQIQAGLETLEPSHHQSTSVS
ncbi:MAG: hypothetical protein RI906_2568 [Pseudomonadota bacterium]|jgi:cyanophycin synthetase